MNVRIVLESPRVPTIYAHLLSLYALMARAPRPATKRPFAASCSGLKSSFCLSIMSGAATFMAQVPRRTALLGADSWEAAIWATVMPPMARPNLRWRMESAGEEEEYSLLPKNPGGHVK